MNSLNRAQRDIGTSKTLIENKRYDWSLAISYNAMLQAGRALMFERGYRPSSVDGHVTVVKFLRAVLGGQASDRIILVFNGMRKKRHRILYEEMDIVSQNEAKRSVEWAQEFVRTVEKNVNRRS